jgi:quinol-cytochrome oxidoreductase complex cytochrome b subunit
MYEFLLVLFGAASLWYVLSAKRPSVVLWAMGVLCALALASTLRSLGVLP